MYLGRFEHLSLIGTNLIVIFQEANFPDRLKVMGGKQLLRIPVKSHSYKGMC